MSTKLHLSFAADMPPASVEVVTPDFQTVAQVWLGPGDAEEVEVPSADALVKVHLPSGDTATLRAPGQLEREISRAALGEGAAPRPREAGRSGAKPRAVGAPESGAVPESGLDGPAALRLAPGAPESPGTLGVVLSAGGAPIDAATSGDGRGLLYEPDFGYDAYDLTVRGGPDRPGPLRVRLPGSLSALAVSLPTGVSSPTLRVRAATRHAAADTLGAYLARGDLRAAASMASWVERAEEMLFYKGADPSAATVGAYLLLRLRRFDLMRTWARNLADRWPDLADGSVIWAWQLIQQRKDAEEAEAYLLRAAACTHLPVFTEGLKLLLDGLRLLGHAGAGPAAALDAQLGVMLWDSPFTATLPDGAFAAPLRLDVGYATERLPVESSALDAVGYDEADATMEVAFDDGSVYVYYDVPRPTYEALLGADSKGAYFNAHVKPSGLIYRRVK